LKHRFNTYDRTIHSWVNVGATYLFDEHGRSYSPEKLEQIFNEIYETVTNVSNNLTKLITDTSSNLTDLITDVDENLKKLETSIGDKNAIKADGDTLIEKILSKFKEVSLNVKDFGAVGNGIFDDTVAIQSALNYAKVNTTSSTTVYFPAGVYKLTKKLHLYDSTYLKADRKAKFVRHHNDSMLLNGDEGDSFANNSGNGNIVIEGGIWDGNVLQFNEGFNIFQIGRAYNVLIRDVEFRDVINGHAIDMVASRKVLFEKCRFLGFSDRTEDNSRYMSEAIQIGEHTPDGGFTPFGAFDGEGNEDITIRDCYFGNSGTEGMSPWAVGAGHHSSVHDVFTKNVKVYSNEFDGMTYFGFRSWKFNDLYIQDNRFTNCERGICLTNTNGDWTYSPRDRQGVNQGLPQSSTNIQISHNKFYHTKRENIYGRGWKNGEHVAKMEGVIISHNFFLGRSDLIPNFSNIYLKFANDIKVFHNITMNYYRNLYLGYVSNCDISHNVSNNLTREDVYVDETETFWSKEGEEIVDAGNDDRPDSQLTRSGYTHNVYITKNKVYKCGRTGYYMQFTKNFKIADNIVERASLEADNSRNGIKVGIDSEDGEVSSNYVRYYIEGNKNKYGILVTADCKNIRLFNNDVQGKTGRISLDQTGSNFDGFYIHSPNGDRFKFTVDDTGQPKIYK
jgi:polygalacturonase